MAAAALVVGTLVVTSAVFAVHDEGVFQLDGNATTQPGVTDLANPVSDQTGTHDWDQVYAGRNSNAIPNPNSGAQSQAFVTDVFGAADSILTGGSTKDIYDPGNSWLWKQTSTTTVQDKDDIEHAFAAQYNVDKSGTGQHCGTGTNGLPISGTTNCVLLYFGATRFSNSGNTTMGFWFFKNKVTPNALPNALPTGGQAGFTGHHTARTTVNGVTVHGDILVVSDFLIGGAAPTVTVFEWVGSGGSDGALDRIGGGSAILSDCTQGAAPKQNTTPVPPVADNDNLCATTNANLITAPWPFTPKANSVPTGTTGKIGISEFMEGGVNMTALGLGNECFNTFLAETRASSSPTSTLSDFALGTFGSCNATALTTPSAGNGTNAVSPGTPVTDTITITGHSSGGNPPTPSSAAADNGSNVVFSYCGPMLVTDTTGVCDDSDAAHTDATFGQTKPLSQFSPGVATATSDQINTSTNPLAPGRYCFVGSWAGDKNYTDGASDSSVGECFTVRQISTSIATTPSASSTGSPAITTTQALGTLLYDKATVTAAQSGGGDINGSVTFFICTPAQVTANGGDCHTGGTQVGTTTVALSPVANADPPQSTAVSTPGVAANVAGTWCFRGSYTVTGTTYTAGAADGSTGECVQVGPESTTTVTTPRATGTTTTFTTGAVNSSVTDHAVVTAADSVDGTPTGTIDFFICNPTVVASNGGDCHTGGTAAGSVTAAAVANSSPPASSGDSNAVIANVVGTWCFRAVYSPSGANGGNYTTSHDWSTTECFTITDSTGATSAQTWRPNDSATITSVGGTALSGTLSFTLFDSSNCTGTILYQEDTDPATTGVQPYSFSNATSPVTRSTTNATVSVLTSRTVSWLVTFTSSSSLVTGSSHCESTALTITN